jgi:hypothetical protein
MVCPPPVWIPETFREDLEETWYLKSERRCSISIYASNYGRLSLKSPFSPIVTEV